MLKNFLKPRFQPVLSRRFESHLLNRPTVSCSLKPKKSLNILFFANKHNSLSQRMALELRKRQHNITVHEINEPVEMTKLAFDAQPDLILCPFLTKRIPEEVFSNPNIPCWIVHPGIEGDRGMSSIDWALYDREEEWGVSVLQAASEMDAGDIWSTKTFPVRRPEVNTLTKSSMYVNEVTQTAVKAVLEAIDNLLVGKAPRPLDYSDPQVRGICRPNMTKADRTVNWELPADEIACQIRMSDSAPGAVGRFRTKEADSDWDWTKDFRLFGARLEKGRLRFLPGKPGEILGQSHGSVLVKCGRGALWVSHLKKSKLKLPAMMWLKSQAPTVVDPSLSILYGSYPYTAQDIWTSMTSDGVCFVHFEFYNGAMSTSQCQRLVSVLRAVENNDFCKVMVLMGGRDVFSNGIHLNVIEAADDPVQESWRNINAINDVVRCIFSSRKITISALRGNAGAGGAMLALASDFAFARDGVVLNPHYKLMKLYGSEYHTYFLPKRVGQEKADELLSSAKPILASDAAEIGFLDGSVGDSADEFESWIKEQASYLSRTPLQSYIVREKNKKAQHRVMKNIEECRSNELSIMARNFQDPEYHQARKNFVYH